MEGNLYTLRYKEGAKGLVTAYITASNLEKAKEVGNWFCGQAINRQFIRVEPSIVATEEDLGPEKKTREVAPKVPKPMPADEDERGKEEDDDDDEDDGKSDSSPVTHKPMLERGGKPRVRSKTTK